MVITPIDTTKSISAVLTGEFKVGVPVTSSAYITVTGANTVASDLEGLNNISDIDGLSFSKGTANDNSITYTISGTPDNIYNQNISISNGTLKCDVRLVITPTDITKSISAVLTGEFKVGTIVTSSAYITVTGANTVASDLDGLNNISSINGLWFSKGTANDNSITYTISGTPDNIYNQNITISNDTLTCDVRLVIAPIDTVKSISAVLTGEFKVGVPVTNGAYITVTGANTVISDLAGLNNISNINGLSFNKGTANYNSVTYTISGIPTRTYNQNISISNGTLTCDVRLVIAPIDTVKSISAVLTGEFKVGVPVTNGAYITVTGANTVISDLDGLKNISNINGLSFDKGTANDNSITYTISGTPDNIYNQNITISNGTLTCDVRLVITPIDTVKSISAVLTGEFKVGTTVTDSAYITITGANTVASDLDGLNDITDINGLSFTKGTANDNSITYTISGTPDNIYNQNITISNGTLTCDVCLVITPIDATKSLKFELVNSTINVNDKSTFNFTIQSYNYTFSSSELRLNGDPENELLFNMDEGKFTLTTTAHAGILSLSISDSTNIINSNIVQLVITDNVVRNLPMTTNFFTFKNNSPDTKTITGYALNFLTACGNPTLLNAYLTDHGATGVNGLCFSDYHIAGTQNLLSPSKTGYGQINNFYKTLINLDFSNAIFDWLYGAEENVDNSTGYSTFAYCNFESVININFLNTNFTPTLTNKKNVITAYGTFQSATFKKLTNLNLSGAIFAASDMTDSLVDTAKVYSACETFKSATFTTLTNLNLSGAVFATSKMTNSNQIYTASSTFQSATFTALTNLNLLGAVFAAANMSNSVVRTASFTFQSATFTALTNLNLSGAVFATPNMTISAVVTACGTFQSATFTTLTNLNLLGAVFAAANMSTNAVQTASSTFQSATFTTLTNLNLSGAVFAVTNMSSSTNLYPADDTFKSANFSKLTDLSIGKIQSGINYADNNINTLFGGITKNAQWPTTPLKISGEWSENNWVTKFDSWFNASSTTTGSHDWVYTQTNY